MEPLQKHEPLLYCPYTAELLPERACIERRFSACKKCRMGKSIVAKYGFVFNRTDPDLPSFLGGPEA